MEEVPHEVASLVHGLVVAARVLPRIQRLPDLLIVGIDVLHQLLEALAQPLRGLDEGLLEGGEGVSGLDEIAQHGTGAATVEKEGHSPH